MRALFKREPGLWVVILLPLLMFAGEMFGLTRFAGIDHTKLNMPIKWFDVLAIRHGEFPLWNPFIATGAPHFAEGEPGTLYLINLINHLPGNFFYWYGINIILHFIIAGITCYALLRYKGAGKFSAAVFAVFFQFAPFTMLHLTAVSLFQTLAWIPLLLLLYEMVLDNRRPVLNSYWAILLVFQMICMGSMQTLFYAYFALAFIGIFRSIYARDSRMALRAGAFLIVTALAGGILAAAQLMPTFAFKATTFRAGHLGDDFYAYGTWLNFSRLSVMFLFPASDFSNIQDAIGFGSSQAYIGITAIFCIILAAWHGSMRKPAFPYIWAGLIMLVFAFAWNFPAYHLLVKFPPFSYFRYLGRTSVLFVLFATIPASLGLELFLRERKSLGPVVVKAFIATLVLFAICMLLFFAYNQESTTIGYSFLLVNLLLLCALCFAPMKPANIRQYIIAVILIVHMSMLWPYTHLMTQTRKGFDDSFIAMDKIAIDDRIELKRLMNGYMPWVVDPEALTHPRYTSRDWLIDGMAGLAGTLSEVGCMHIYLPLYETKWLDIIDNRLLMNLRDDPKNLTTMSANFCRVLGINYITVENGTLDLPGYKPFDDEAATISFRPTARLFRNTKPWPRFYLTRNVKSVRLFDEWGFFREMQKEHPNDASLESSDFTVIIPDEQKPPMFPDPELHVEGRVKSARDGFNSYELSVTCDADCYLVARENYYPGWEVRVDGEPAALYQADYVNRAVYVPKGTHNVEFAYRPVEFRIGMIISSAAMLLFILGGILLKLRMNGRASTR